MNEALQARWSYSTRKVTQAEQPKLLAANQSLLGKLLTVSGLYLSCILRRTGSEIGFGYRVRSQEKGFMKLDLVLNPTMAEPLIGGCDFSHYPVGQFVAIAEKYYHREEFESQFLQFVPAIAFGAFGGSGFYIESMYDFSQIDPFFVDASHQFLARLVEAACAGDPAQIARYTSGLANGKDPRKLVEREPLMRTMVAELPEESVKPFYRQLGDEIARLSGRQ